MAASVAETNGDKPSKPVLLTGASGALGRVLAKALGEAGWPVRLTDIAPFPDALAPGAVFEAADLADEAATARLAAGCGAILHFGGVSVEKPFAELLGPNIQGLYNVYEAARLAGARVLFASSNHTVGFHPRTAVLEPDSPFRPDGYYGASKVWGEMMGRLYWHKHGVESVLVRIGSCFPKPVDARMLASWLSYGDLTRLVQRAVLAETTGCAVIWGTSANSRMTWWRGDDRELLGWTPQDSADSFADEVGGINTGDPVQEAHMGAAYCRIGWTRD